MAKKMGRPKSCGETRSERIMISIRPSVLAKINELADDLKVNRSTFLSNLLEVAVDEHKLIIKVGKYTIQPLEEFILKQLNKGKSNDIDCFFNA